MKKIILILLCVALCVSLCSCHKAKKLEAFNVPEELDTSREYEITFWAKNDTNKTQVSIYEKAISDFEALYPFIHVNLRLYTDYSKIYNDVITNISTNTTPDVCITYPDHIATYMTGTNVVVALDKLMSDEKYGLGGSELLFDSPTKDEVVPKFLEECKLGGSYYALPFMRSTEACYVNKTYVEALGFELPEVLTWDFVWEVSEAATKKNEDGTFAVNGQNVMIPFIYKSTDNMMIQLLRQNGYGLSTDEGEILLFSDDTKSILDEIASHVPSGAFSTFKISGYPANFLNAGQCIFAVDSTAGSTWMGSDAPLCDIAEDKIVEFETAVMTVPQVDADNISMISQGPSVCLFNRGDSQQVLAAWLFTQYLLTNDVQIAYSETEGYIPVTLKAQQSDEYLDYLSRSGEDNTTHYPIKIQAVQMLIENTDNTFVTSVFDGSASLRDAAGQLIESVVKSVRRKKSVDDEAIATLYDDTIAQYHLDEISSSSDAVKDLGPLPNASVALLVSLGVVWACIIAYVLLRKRK